MARRLTILNSTLKFFVFSVLIAAPFVPVEAAGLRTIPPEQVSVVAIRGDQPIRNVVLRSDNKLKNLKIIPTDLSRKDGQEVFPAQWITPATTSFTEIKPGEPVSIPIKFNLTQAKASGDFSGILLLKYEGGESIISLQLQMKDAPWLPTAFLVIGILGALGLAWYQAEGMERDEILLQLGRVKLQIQADADVPESFRDSINRVAIVVETALDERRWENARQQISQIQMIWDRWRQWRSDWLKQISYKRASLDQYLEKDVDSDTVFGRELKATLERLTGQMANYETPEDWRQELATVQEQIIFYQKVLQELEQLSEQWRVLSSGRQSQEAVSWEKRKAHLFSQLDELKPTDEDGKKALKSEISVEKQALTDHKTRLNQENISTASHEMRGGNRIVGTVEEPPSVTSTAPDQIVKTSRKNLMAFRWAGRGVAILMLSGAGFQQLYLSNVTFGSAGLGDYLTLLAWGFGAEVTRDSVTKALKKLRLPGLKEE
jgi:hypothetical protein